MSSTNKWFVAKPYHDGSRLLLCVDASIGRGSDYRDFRHEAHAAAKNIILFDTQAEAREMARHYGAGAEAHLTEAGDPWSRAQ
jgi:hypothetical protein